MTDDVQVHHTFDSTTGRLVLICRDAASFEHLRSMLCRAANVGVMVNIPPAPVRSVSLELAEHVEPTVVGLRSTMASWGCGLALLLAGGVFLLGVGVVVGWLRG